MADKSVPSPQSQNRMLFKRVFHWKNLLRLAGWGLLFVYAFIALVLTITRFWVIPNIDKYYPQLETYLENQLNTEIDVDSISADWRFIVPRLTITNMTLSRHGEKASLTLPKVQITFSLESLFKLRPITSRIVIINPDLQIERLTSHVFNIGGFTIDTASVEQNAKNDSLAFEGRSSTPYVFDFLLNQRHIEINNGHFSYLDCTETSPKSVQLTNTNVLLHRYSLAWKAGIQSTLIGTQKTYLDLRASFKERLFGENNRLHNLYGTVYANIPDVDFGLIANRLNLDHFVQKGHGQTSVWMTFEDLRPSSITSDISLSNVSIRWTPEGKPFEFDSFQGRIEQTLSDNNFLKIKSHDVIVKPKNKAPYYLGDAQLQAFIKDGNFYDGEMQLEFFDLQALSTIGLQLPLPQKGRDAIRQVDASGLIENFESTWRGSINNPTQYELSMLFKGLSISGLPIQNNALKNAGFRNLSGHISLNEKGGELTLDAPDSRLDFPGIFAENRLVFDTLKLNGSWVMAPVVEFKFEDLIASNTDASVQLHGGWKNTGDLGTLEVRGNIQYLNAKSAYRYVPIVAGGWGTNNWLKGALQGGIARNAKVDVFGPLRQFPFKNSENPDYIFRISGNVEDVTLDYLPSMKKDAKGQWIPGEWPQIRQIQGSLAFEADSMVVNVSQARTKEGALLHDVTAEIPSYGAHGVPLLITGHARGALSAMTDYVNQSPISGMIGHALENSQSKGNAALNLELMIPITEAHKTEVKGEVHLENNFVHLDKVPPMDKANGSVIFSEKGVWAPKLTAEVHGKSVAGSINTAEDGKISILASGVVDAPMVSKIIDSPSSTSLLDFIEGEAYANVRVDIQKGVSVYVNSALMGAYTNLPAPLNKQKDEVWPLTFEMTPCTNTKECSNRMRLSVQDHLLKMDILFDSTERGLKANRGYFAINTPVNTIPSQTGLSLYINTPNLLWSEWGPILSHITQKREADPNADLKTMTLNRIVANVNHLDYNGMIFSKVNVNAAASRQDIWNASFASNLFKGQLKWTPGVQGKHDQVNAQFDYLTIPQKKLVDGTLKLVPKATESLPSLTLSIGQLKYIDYDLGRLTLSAQNKGFGTEQSWALERFELQTPEAKLSANGLWNSGNKKDSRTTLNATLDINDVGELLDRAHYQKTIKDGSGQINAQLQWQGAPVDFNTETLNGQIATQLISGQITQVEPGAGRLMSLMSLQQLLRRFALDFRDVVGQGFVFDTINGTIDINNGLATSDTLRIVGPQASILSQGWLDLNNLTQKVKISVIPDISFSGASIALAVANPLLGVGSFLAQLALQAPLSQLFSVEYEVTGTIDKPVIQKVDGKQTTASAQAP